MIPNPTQSLGQLEEPLLLFGGPYGNLEATQAMRTEAERLGYQPHQIFCTGDLVAYCASPKETVDLILDWGIQVVQGNCEQSLADDLADCGCGFNENSTCSLLSAEWFAFARNQVTREQKQWMGTLPGSIEFQIQGIHVKLVHGTHHSVNEFVFPGTDRQRKQLLLSELESDLVVGGHCGVPFSESIESKLWVNAGVIGMPANDGTPDVWYLRISPVDRGLELYWHRLNYDFKSAQQRMFDADLCVPYQRALETGLWPSLDVMPESDRANSGNPLRMQPAFLERISQPT